MKILSFRLCYLSFTMAWVLSLHCPFKNFFLFFDVNSLERHRSEQAYGKRKVAQLKGQQVLSLDTQSINDFKKVWQIRFISIDNNRHRYCTALTFGPPATPG